MNYMYKIFIYAVPTCTPPSIDMYKVDDTTENPIILQTDDVELQHWHIKIFLPDKPRLDRLA